jgi:hypothetical protein
MTLSEIIATLQREHCGPCKIGAAIAALQGLGGPVQVTVCPPAAARKIAKRIGPAAPPRGKRADAKARTEKPCHKCGKPKPIADYPTNHQCADGHTGTCKDCTKERVLKAKGEKTAPVEPDLDIYPKECLLCHAPISSATRYKHHMQMVHNKVA